MMKPKNILLIDTGSTKGCVALLTQDNLNVSLKSYSEWTEENSHSESIIQKIQEVLLQSHLSLIDIDSIGVGNGPGSFTGIRVGLNVGRSLSYSLKKPGFVFSSLKSLALSTEFIFKTPVLTLVNAYKNQMYIAMYSWSEENKCSSELISPTVVEPSMLHQLDIGPCYIVGNGIEDYKSMINANFFSEDKIYVNTLTHPEIKNFGVRLIQDQSLSKEMTWREIKPLYIRASEAEEKLMKGLLKSKSLR